MDKEKILLDCLKTVEKNPRKNEDAIRTGLQLLLNISPKVGIKHWEDLIKAHYDDIKKDFNKKEFDYEDIGYLLVYDFERYICDDSQFKPALEDFSKSEYLLDVLYTKSPLETNFGGRYAIGYLIRHDRLDEADRILTAIYENKKFKAYEDMWNEIFFTFKFGEDYNPGMFREKSEKQPEHIIEFVVNWIEKIPIPKQKKAVLKSAEVMY